MKKKKKLPNGGGVGIGGRFRFRKVNVLLDENRQVGRGPDGDVIVLSVVEEGVWHNGAVTQGLNYLADAGFRGSTQISTWYASLINQAAYSAIADADTAASHAGWAEWTGYDEAVRQTWSPAAASAGVLVNGTVMTFTNNTGSTVSIRGMFLQSTSGKGATTGTLWATAVEGSARSLADGQAFQVIYETEFTPVS